MNLSQRRNSVRHEGEIPLLVKQGTGQTRNLSPSGLYFITDQELAVGEQAEVVLLLDHTGFGPGQRLYFQGEVLRVEPREKEHGIAFAITSHAFNDAAKRAQA